MFTPRNHRTKPREHAIHGTNDEHSVEPRTMERERLRDLHCLEVADNACGGGPKKAEDPKYCPNTTYGLLLDAARGIEEEFDHKRHDAPRKKSSYDREEKELLFWRSDGPYHRIFRGACTRRERCRLEFLNHFWEVEQKKFESDDEFTACLFDLCFECVANQDLPIFNQQQRGGLGVQFTGCMLMHLTKAYNSVKKQVIQRDLGAFMRKYARYTREELGVANHSDVNEKKRLVRKLVDSPDSRFLKKFFDATVKFQERAEREVEAVAKERTKTMGMYALLESKEAELRAAGQAAFRAAFLCTFAEFKHNHNLALAKDPIKFFGGANFLQLCESVRSISCIRKAQKIPFKKLEAALVKQKRLMGTFRPGGSVAGRRH